MIMGKEQDYAGESDARTLQEAHAIRKDKKKHAHAMKHLKIMAKRSTHAEDTHSHEVDAHEAVHGTPPPQPEQTAGSEANAEGTQGAGEAEPMMEQEME